MFYSGQSSHVEVLKYSGFVVFSFFCVGKLIQHQSAAGSSFETGVVFIDAT